MTNDYRKRTGNRIREKSMDLSGLPVDDVLALTHELQVHLVELEKQNEELRRAQTELAEARAWYVDLFEFAPIGYVTLDARQTLLHANLRLPTMLGTERRALIGRKFSALVASGYEADCYRRLRGVLSSREETAFEAPFRRQDGSSVWCLVRCVPARGVGEGQGGLRCTVSDISHRKVVEQLLEESRERLELALEAGEMGTWDVDFETNEVTWNLELFQLLGYPKPVPITWETFFAHVHADDLDRVRSRWERILKQGTELTDEFRVVRLDDAVRWLATRGRLTRDRSGRPARLIGVNYDVTHRKETEAYLQRLVEEQTADLRMLSARLLNAQEEERRRIAAGLHDDIGQLVAACQLALTRAGVAAEDEPRNALLRDANRLLDEVSDGIRALTFELSSDALFEGGFVPAVRELCQHTFRRHCVAFRVDCADEAMPVPKPLCPLLYHCLRELLLNTVKHSQTDHADVRLERLPARPGSETGEGAILRIVVRDYGKGFDPARLDEPLTREGGFGLRSIRERIRDIGGRLMLEAIPGDGCRAVVEVPLTDASVPRDNGRSPAP